MLKYSLSDYFWLYIYCTLIWLLLFISIKYFYKKKSNTNFERSLTFLSLVAITFSYLGTTIGLLIGLSISPVIGVVIPALLTFFGGFITYIFVFGKKNEQDGYVIMVIVGSLSFTLMLGSDYGSAIRTSYEFNNALREEEKKKEYEIFKSQLNKGNVSFEMPGDESSKTQVKTGTDTIRKTEFEK